MSSRPNRKRIPKYKLLKDAYVIIDGIPSNKIDLEVLVTKFGKSLARGTICCPAGWLGHHPQFQALGLGVHVDKYMLTFEGRRYVGSYTDQMMDVFGLSHNDARDIFNAKQGCETGTDKEIWLKRVRGFLKNAGQL